MSESLADLKRYAESAAGQMAHEAFEQFDTSGLDAALLLAQQAPHVRGLEQHIIELRALSARPLPNQPTTRSFRPTLAEILLRHQIVLFSSDVIGSANDYFDLLRWQRPEIVCVCLHQWMRWMQRECVLRGRVEIESIRHSIPGFRELEAALIGELIQLANSPLSDLDARAEVSAVWQWLRYDLAKTFVRARIVPINAYARAVYDEAVGL